MLHVRRLILCLVMYFSFTALAWASDKPFVIGMLLVGPYNDKGWSQAHYEGARYVEKKIPGLSLIYLDKVNPADRPGLTIPQMVDEMADKGARLILATSDDMTDGIMEAAKAHPELTFIHVSGDEVLTGKAPANLGNLMGKMEYAQMMAGFAAAMSSKSGKLGYLGPLINDETRRQANAVYLGAAYAWRNIRGKSLDELSFQVNWIGFWFNIPGVTSDPSQVTAKFFDQGCDVVISGLDTPEALSVAAARRKAGAEVFAVPYDYRLACEAGSEACLGAPYFNWGPSYLEIVRQVMAGTWNQSWLWLDPDWKDLNNLESSAVGYAYGAALTPKIRAELDKFTAELASGALNLYSGPLSYQDGALFLKPGEKATDEQIWFCPQLLKGMQGQSQAK